MESRLEPLDFRAKYTKTEIETKALELNVSTVFLLLNNFIVYFLYCFCLSLFELTKKKYMNTLVSTQTEVKVLLIT